MTTMESTVLALAFGLAANVMADVILRVRYRTTFVLDTATKRMKHRLRWVACFAALLMAALALHMTALRLLLLALFSVTAATDFEHKRLPWDWFLYGSTALGIVVGFWESGPTGFRDAVIAQAIFFGMMTLTVVISGSAAGGDIKMMMQYGAASGHIVLAMAGLLLGTLACWVPLRLFQFFATASRKSQPLPLTVPMWVGLLLSFAIGGVYGIGIA